MGRTFLGSRQTKYHQHLFACVNVRNFFIYGSDLIYSWCIFSQISRVSVLDPLLSFPLVTRNFSLLHLYTPGHLMCSETYFPLNCLGSLNTSLTVWSLCFIRISWQLNNIRTVMQGFRWLITRLPVTHEDIIRSIRMWNPGFLPQIDVFLRCLDRCLPLVANDKNFFVPQALLIYVCLCPNRYYKIHRSFLL